MAVLSLKLVKHKHIRNPYLDLPWFQMIGFLENRPALQNTPGYDEQEMCIF